MLRLGKLPITIPSNVQIEINKPYVTVNGPLGQLTKILPSCVDFSQNLNILSVLLAKESKETLPFLGLTRTLIQNMINGVLHGFSKQLQMIGIGYKAVLENTNTLILYCGYSHTVELQIPLSLNLKIENFTLLTIFGIDKILVGQFAAQIRSIKSPEPYKGKGIRYVNELISFKTGKSVKK